MKHIFIGGCPRSGTTMLGNILGSSNQSIVVPESDFLIKYYLKNIEKQYFEISDFIQYLDKNWRFSQWEMDLASVRFPIGSIKNSEFCDVVDLLGNAYAISLGKPDVEFFVEHTPKNSLYSSHLLKLFPDSKLIVIIRDPRAVYSSMKKLDWGSNSALHLSNLWIEYMGASLATRALFPERVFFVKYEDILISPEPNIKSICQFIDIEFSQNLLNGKGLKIPSYTKNQHKLVGGKLDVSRINAWKTTLSEYDIEIMESKLSIYLDLFNYPYEKDNFKFITRRDIVRSSVNESFSTLINLINKKYRQRGKSI